MKGQKADKIFSKKNSAFFLKICYLNREKAHSPLNIIFQKKYQAQSSFALAISNSLFLLWVLIKISNFEKVKTGSLINPETRKPFHLGYQPPKQWVPLYNSAQKISTKDSNHPRQHINLKVNHSWIRDMALKFIKPKLYVHFSNETRDRSSHGRSSVRKVVLRHLAKFTGKHLCQSLFFKKVAGLRRNSFTEHLQGTASKRSWFPTSCS